MSASYPIATPATRSSRAGIGGPKTAEGRARSALNAVKHGLTSANPVILEHETDADRDSFREPFVAALHPVGAVEEALALELATTEWRRRRLPRYEARAAGLRIQRIEPQLADIDHRCTPAELEHRAAELFNEALLPDFNTADRLLRYEAHLDRKFNHAFRHLERLQKTRRTLESPETLDYKTNSNPAPSPQPPAPSPTPEPPASIDQRERERPVTGVKRGRGGCPPDREGRSRLGLGWSNDDESAPSCEPASSTQA